MSTVVEAVGRVGSEAAWQSKRLKDLVNISFSSVDKKAHDGQVPVRLCNYVDVYYNDRITDDLAFMEATASAEELRRFGLRSGDVLVTKDSETPEDIGIPAIVEVDAPDLVSGYHLALLRPRAGVDGRFIKWLFDSAAVKRELATRANGLTRYGLGLGQLGAIPVQVPPYGEQRTVVEYLDRETGRIDALIAKHEQLIRTLEERRRAAIEQTVFSGVFASAALRDSGVGWIGLLPEAWDLRPLRRYAADDSGSFVDGDWIESPFITDEGTRLLQTGNVGVGVYREQGGRYISDDTFLELGCTEVQPGDLLICRLADPVGRSCIAPNLGVRMVTSVDVCILRPATTTDVRYLNYLLSSDRYLGHVASLSRGGTRERVSRSVLGRIVLPAPPLDEQRAIAGHLDDITERIDQLAATARALIERLRERRLALISAAVTGQIDVRGS